MEPECSLPHSQEPATCPYPEPDQSSAFTHPNSWRQILILSFHLYLGLPSGLHCRSQWSRDLRRRSAATRLLRLWVRIPPGAWMSVCCDCCVSGRSLCDELITRTEESYRLCCVVVCDPETSRMRRSWPTGGCCAKKKKWSPSLTYRHQLL